MNARINIVRFPLVVAIVFIHSNHTLINSVSGFSLFIKEYISNGLASVAVPAFFLISGYLFFNNMDWNRESYIKKLRSRVKTLVIPYLAWNLVALTYMWAIFKTLGANTNQFWFLQELMLLVVITPVFHWLHKKAWLALLTMLSVWLFNDWSLNFPVMSSIMPMLFFYTGSVLAVKKKSLFTLDKYGWILLALVLCVFVFHDNTMIRKFGILLGVPAVLYLSKFGGKTLLSLSGASFFVYCYHEPIMGQMLGLTLKHLSTDSDLLKLAIYFAFAIGTVAVGVFLYTKMKNIVPEFTEFLTGRKYQV